MSAKGCQNPQFIQSARALERPLCRVRSGRRLYSTSPIELPTIHCNMDVIDGFLLPRLYQTATEDWYHCVCAEWKHQSEEGHYSQKQSKFTVAFFARGATPPTPTWYDQEYPVCYLMTHNSHKPWNHLSSSVDKKWRCWGLNPGPRTCEAHALPLSYIPSDNMPQYLYLSDKD